MARSSSYGSRRTAWAVDQKPRSMPRVVRLGRPANDNLRQPSMSVRLIVVALATAFAILALHDWWLI
jgi:hypothetical protein